MLFALSGRITRSGIPKRGLKRKHRPLAGLCALFFLMLHFGVAHSQELTLENAANKAVEYCRGEVARPMALGWDGRILCFDGLITTDQDISPVKGLANHGLFVVRSPGGSIATAIALGTMLHELHATVVIYDYCVSACAGYLSIASDRTFVLKDSIVAWHNWASGLPDCPAFEPVQDGGPSRLTNEPCPEVPLEARARFLAIKAAHQKFYAERVIDPDFIFPPESVYVRRALKNMLGGRGIFPNVVWTWNPRFYKSTVKTQITFEAYPKSQDEVDTLAAKFRLGRVIYDP
jgi:hypothetical protein